ncbi:hypothetical protein IAT38_007291 [Cryptococcus sp. DSM 104549]
MKVAIIGGGVGGLSSLWTLSEFSEHDVHIYERDDWWGGHAHTVEFQRPGKDKCEIDTLGGLTKDNPAILAFDSAFIAINSKNYPNFYRFIQDSAVDLIKTTMSFSLSRDLGAFEWASNDLTALFCQGANVFKPRVYRMMWDIFRFHIFAKDLLSEEGESEELSIGEYLDREGYSQSFKEDYLLPLTAGIWSIPPEKVALDFPAMALVRFFHNHQMLQLWGKPSWLTVKGGSKRYVDKIIKKIPSEKLHLKTGIEKVTPLSDGGVLVREASGVEVRYDKVIMATHTDQAVRLLGESISPEEKSVLSGCEWSANEAVVHYDEALMPVRKRAWTAWNYLTSTRPIPQSLESKTTASDVSTISITFNLNILQGLPVAKHGLIFVTLNPPTQPDPAKTLSRWVYHHPTLTNALLRAQKELPTIQGKRGLYFVGAWTGYGFHEDGWRAGMEVCYRPEFGLTKRPWELMRMDARALKRETGEGVLRPIIGGIDWGCKGVWAWATWTIGLYLSVIRTVVDAIGASVAPKRKNKMS